MKSKASATRMRNPTTNMLALSVAVVRGLASLGVLECDALDDVGDIFAPVDGVLEEFVDILPLDDPQRVLAVLKQPRHGAPEQRVAFILAAVDLHAHLQDAIAVFQVAQAAHEAA